MENSARCQQHRGLPPQTNTGEGRHVAGLQHVLRGKMLRARRGEVLRLRSTVGAQYQLLGVPGAGELLLGLLEGREGGRAEGAAVGGRVA